MAQNAILLILPGKSNFYRKRFATKFLCRKASSGKVVATSFLYLLTVHTRIAGDVPIYQKFALKVTHPFRKCRFRQFRLIVPQLWKLAKNVQLSLIGSRQCAFHPDIDEHCALPLKPQMVAQNDFFTFGVAFHFFVAGTRRHFKFNMRVEHSKSQRTDDKPSLKWAWSRHVTYFQFIVPLRYLWNGLS